MVEEECDEQGRRFLNRCGNGEEIQTKKYNEFVRAEEDGRRN